MLIVLHPAQNNSVEVRDINDNIDRLLMQYRSAIETAGGMTAQLAQFPVQMSNSISPVKLESKPPKSRSRR